MARKLEGMEALVRRVAANKGIDYDEWRAEREAQGVYAQRRALAAAS